MLLAAGAVAVAVALIGFERDHDRCQVALRATFLASQGPERVLERRADASVAWISAVGSEGASFYAYLPPEDAFPEGGYEVNWPLGFGISRYTQNRIADAIEPLLQKHAPSAVIQTSSSAQSCNS